jgi:hypothetical protein
MNAVRTVAATFLLLRLFPIACRACNSDLTAPRSVSAFRFLAAALVCTTTLFALPRVTACFFPVPEPDSNSVRNRL